LFVSQVVSARGPVASAQAAAVNANETRTRARAQRMRRDIEPPGLDGVLLQTPANLSGGYARV